MRFLGIAFILLLTIGCGNSQQAPDTQGVYRVTFRGTSADSGSLVFTSPQRIQIDVAGGLNALDLALRVRDELQSVICLIDEGERGVTLLVRSNVAISSGESRLVGISWGVNEVVQREEAVQSVVRSFLHYLSSNGSSRLQDVTTPSFYGQVEQQLGMAVSLVDIGRPVIGCRAASVVAEIQLPGGEYQQVEFRLITEREPSWRVDGLVTLIEWTP